MAHNVLKHWFLFKRFVWKNHVSERIMCFLHKCYSLWTQIQTQEVKTIRLVICTGNDLKAPPMNQFRCQSWSCNRRRSLARISQPSNSEGWERSPFTLRKTVFLGPCRHFRALLFFYRTAQSLSLYPTSSPFWENPKLFKPSAR